MIYHLDQTVPYSQRHTEISSLILPPHRDITEMQVKTHVKAIFPKAIGPPTMQLAKEKTITSNEKRGGESRSFGLERDIKITESNEEAPHITEADHDLSGDNSGTVTTTEMARQARQARQPSIDLDEFLGNRRLVEDLASAHPHRRARSPSVRGEVRSDRVSNHSMSEGNRVNHSWRMPPMTSSSRKEGNLRQDGRRREGIYGPFPFRF